MDRAAFDAKGEKPTIRYGKNWSTSGIEWSKPGSGRRTLMCDHIPVAENMQRRVGSDVK
ncbi:hypothetical protein CY34DRAFT_807540 [Suillus luteus UH-Slu-Lm8-n1]|uniref:Uncharacterized protein n=1 Tax=Suillus luteus UH-Slu-Lm8-n1 TaxID=930992 RepID=A0A0C9ZQX3_9AGAM|nr:hypothetical protein CY34DRAFT_807540 [Suillus luteus UH-Slu-Lm8-n1]